MKIKGIYLLYRLLQALGWPILLLYFLGRGLRRRAYFGTLRQRCGFLPASFKQTVPGAIWLHAVSVGEVISAVELVRELRLRLPRSPVFVSVSTLAGYATAIEKLQDLGGVFYAPLDYVFAVRRVLRALRPSLTIVMETEIWPNLFRETKRAGAGLLLINGRISGRALGHYRALRWFLGGAIAQVDLLLAQSEEMRQRWIAIGAPPEKVRAAGNLKYDFEAREAAPESPVRRMIERLHPRAVWIAASTMPPAAAGDPDEDAVVIAAFRQVSARQPALLLLLAPRKPERFDRAAQALERAGIPFVRRSGLAGSGELPLPGVLLLDSIGELASLFPLAGAVFMGGTLASRGGHNILEPALAARPIVAGPHMENFAEIAADFRAAGALVEVHDADSLAAAVSDILEHPARAADLGAKAARCARTRQGATAYAASQVSEIFARHVPLYRPAQPGFAFLRMFSWLWIWGGKHQRARDLARRRRLEAPVISVGNITVGGTGKTPMVLHLVRRLKDGGWKPGILTRGYGRHSPHSHQVVAAGAHVPVSQSGDEPQLFLRAGVAPVGIGADRWRVGRLLEQEFGIDVIVLDDGFQHVRLDRRLDILLVDALDPFGGGYVLPLGRLREPLAGLSRADIFVVTRSESGRVAQAAEHFLRRQNPRAPVFHARAQPEAWVSAATGETIAADALPYKRVAAFCGLGNPGYFWYTLTALGLHVPIRIEYEDHHAYIARELRYMGRQFRDDGIEAVLTTEKDLVNLCDDPGHLLAPLPLYWLRIGLHLDREDEFLDAISQRLR
ncbi:MAG TPA: tetraacyldisaccharide 4'-kinase [Bryobacteraceae bacterium]|nr:tetraacyldisaccharide 4'-kinase [Bryobacteraceae bacterium]